VAKTNLLVCSNCFISFKKQGRGQKAEGRREEGLTCLFHTYVIVISRLSVHLQLYASDRNSIGLMSFIYLLVGSKRTFYNDNDFVIKLNILRF
jgi:hypothetical protein